MRKLVFLFMIVTLLGMSTPAQALIIGPDWVKFNPATKTISGATATITDITGGVQIVMNVTNFPSGSQDVTEWYFNVGANISLDTATFPYVSGVHATSIDLQDKADGTGGVFDLHFTFATSGSDTFTVLKSSTYQVLLPNLTAAAFNSMSQGGQEDYVSAIKNGEAFWGTNTAAAAVPEPATLLLIGVGLIGLAGVSRKFRK
jgi:hypothetical protein